MNLKKLLARNTKRTRTFLCAVHPAAAVDGVAPVWPPAAGVGGGADPVAAQVAARPSSSAAAVPPPPLAGAPPWKSRPIVTHHHRSLIWQMPQIVLHFSQDFSGEGR